MLASSLPAAAAAHEAAALIYAGQPTNHNARHLTAAYRAWREAVDANDPLFADGREWERQHNEAGAAHYETCCASC